MVFLIHADQHHILWLDVDIDISTGLRINNERCTAPQFLVLNAYYHVEESPQEVLPLQPSRPRIDFTVRLAGVNLDVLGPHRC